MRAAVLAAAALAGFAGMLRAEPRRIVSAAPGITETLFALGLGSRVVGVSQYCRYPAEARALPKVGGYLRPDVEAIVALRPDLVIVQYAPNRVVAQLGRLKIDVLELEHGNLAHTLAMIRLIGERTGAAGKAAALAGDIRARLDGVRRRAAGRKKRSLVFIVGRSPGRLDGLIAVGKGSFLNELIAIAGGVNALAGSVAPYPKIALETMAALDPDVIVDMGDMGEVAKLTEAHRREVLALWRRLPHLEAVKKGRVWVAASDVFVIPGPRLAQAAEEFEKMLYPEAAR